MKINELFSHFVTSILKLKISSMFLCKPYSLHSINAVEYLSESSRSYMSQHGIIH